MIKEQSFAVTFLFNDNLPSRPLLSRPEEENLPEPTVEQDLEIGEENIEPGDENIELENQTEEPEQNKENELPQPEEEGSLDKVKIRTVISDNNEVLLLQSRDPLGDEVWLLPQIFHNGGNI